MFQIPAQAPSEDVEIADPIGEIPSLGAVATFDTAATPSGWRRRRPSSAAATARTTRAFASTARSRRIADDFRVFDVRYPISAASAAVAASML
jgi:hypothetical protein